MTTKRRSSLRIANTLGAFGYLAICVQWVWLIVTQIMPRVADSGAKDLFVPPTPSVATEPAAISLPDSAQLLLIIGAVIFSIIISVYAVLIVPKTVGRAGKTITQTSARAATGQVAKHRTYSKSSKLHLQKRLTWAIKLLLIAPPVAALLIPVMSQVGLNNLQVTVVGLVLAATSLSWFILQASVVLLAKLRTDDIW